MILIAAAGLGDGDLGDNSINVSVAGGVKEILGVTVNLDSLSIEGGNVRHPVIASLALLFLELE